MYEIQAAIIGGAVAGVLNGVVVFGALSLTEKHTKRNERDAQLMADAQRASMLLPIALLYLGPEPPDDKRLTLGSSGWEVGQELTSVLVRMILLAREVQGDRGKRLAQAIDGVNARYLAAQARTIVGSPLSLGDMLSITGSMENVATILHPERFDITDQVKHYMEHGFN